MEMECDFSFCGRGGVWRLLAFETYRWNYRDSAMRCLNSLWVILPLVKAVPRGTINWICSTHFYPELTTAYNCSSSAYYRLRD